MSISVRPERIDLSTGLARKGQTLRRRFFKKLIRINDNCTVERHKWLRVGARPALLTGRRGDGVEALIDRIEGAVQSYPYQNLHRVWPGPNSNTFTAHIARRLPELGLVLPSNALGKDYLGDWRLIAPMPSGTGWQFSVGGLIGIGLAREEGFEMNLFGLAAG